MESGRGTLQKNPRRRESKAAAVGGLAPKPFGDFRKHFSSEESAVADNGKTTAPPR